MITYLLDTNIVSELAPGRKGLPSSWLAELRRAPEGTRISVTSLFEIEEGICKLRRTGAKRRASDLESWLEELLSGFESDIVPIDRELARAVGRLADLPHRSGAIRASPIYRSRRPLRCMGLFS